MKKPKIVYPTAWIYKLITNNPKVLEKNIVKLVDKDYKLLPSRKSTNGKFSSFNLELVVKSEEERHKLFQDLKNLEEVFYVL